MSTRITTGYAALTDKEKQTLRLIVRGHDAKSVARSLDLSVHTINERLRDARRKLAVSSSRAAARLVLDTEGETLAVPPANLSGDTEIGDAVAPFEVEQGSVPTRGARRKHRRWIIAGAILMSFVLGFLALMAQPQSPATVQDAASSNEAVDAQVVESARQWLVLVDHGRWADSYRATGASFRSLNTLQVWTSVSQQVRTPLGALVSRVLIGQENLPAPPHGYEVVKFRTSFANKADTVETVTLNREDGGWHVVGVTIG